jgi:hypothetical protein
MGPPKMITFLLRKLQKLQYSQLYRLIAQASTHLLGATPVGDPVTSSERFGPVERSDRHIAVLARGPPENDYVFSDFVASRGREGPLSILATNAGYTGMRCIPRRHARACDAMHATREGPSCGLIMPGPQQWICGSESVRGTPFQHIHTYILQDQASPWCTQLQILDLHVLELDPPNIHLFLFFDCPPAKRVLSTRSSKTPRIYPIILFLKGTNL